MQLLHPAEDLNPRRRPPPLVLADLLERLGQLLVARPFGTRDHVDERLLPLFYANAPAQRQLRQYRPAESQVMESGPQFQGALAVLQGQQQDLFVQVEIVAGR